VHALVVQKTLWSDQLQEATVEDHFVDVSCTFLSKSGPRLFIKQRPDGAGASLESVLYGMAVAFKNNMRFGGIVGGGHSSHHLDIGSLVRNFSGCSVSFVGAKKHTFTSSIASVLGMEELLKKHQMHQDDTIYVNAASLKKAPTGVAATCTFLDEYFTTDFLERMRNVMPWIHRPSDMEPNLPVAVMHVRRGDVSDHIHADKFEPDSVYMKLTDSVKEMIPKAVINVYSEEEGFNKAAYEGRGMTLHLDGHDILDIWAHMANADILRVAKSGFSWLPAYFNKHCVVYTPFSDDRRVMRSWIDADDQAALKECLASLSVGESTF